MDTYRRAINVILRGSRARNIALGPDQRAFSLPKSTLCRRGVQVPSDNELCLILFRLLRLLHGESSIATSYTKRSQAQRSTKRARAARNMPTRRSPSPLFVDRRKELSTSNGFGSLQSACATSIHPARLKHHYSYILRSPRTVSSIRNALLR